MEKRPGIIQHIVEKQITNLIMIRIAVKSKIGFFFVNLPALVLVLIVTEYRRETFFYDGQCILDNFKNDVKIMICQPEQVADLKRFVKR